MTWWITLYDNLKSHFSRDHRIGKVPRGDHCGDADGLPDEDELLGVGRRGDHVPVDPPGLLAEPLEEREAVGHLASRLDYGLALMGMGDSELQSWPKKNCPRLRDSACWRRGEITQHRTNFFVNSVEYRVTHLVDSNLLTSNWKLCFSIGIKSWQNFFYDVNKRFESTWRVTL